LLKSLVWFLAANGSAACTAKILGAIFGKVGFSNLEFRDLGMEYLFFGS
jgi:hypothetical protein